MKQITALRLAAALALGLFVSAPAQAADYPTQQIKVVVPLPPGSAPDFLSRIFGAYMQQQWGQTVLVENKPGAAQNLGAEQVARAAPDGYTLLTAPPPPIALNKFLFPNLKYDPDKFTPVTVICSVPNVLLVRNSLPATNLAEFVALARKSGGLTYASTGAGSTLHLTAEILRAKTGADLVHVPFKGTGEVMTELLAGRVDFAFANLLDAWPHLSSGGMRALAIGSEKRDPSLPDVPALSEMWPDLVSTTWFAVVAPPDTPREIAEKLSAGVRAAFQAPEAAKRLQELRATPVLNTPTEAARIFKQDSERWGAVIKANNIKGE
jgi:tripartite-type tricarboxylate transporter receptor subunit TctC